MIIIGLTGTVGTGKSETCKFLRKKRIPVFDSDYEVKQLYKKKSVLDKIKKKFPEAFKNNILIKENLSRIVFNDQRQLFSLERIIHGLLKNRSYLWIREQYRSRKKIVVFDVPLLFEKDNVKKYDRTIVLSCSEKIQKIRVLRRKGWNEKKFLRVKELQLEDKKKKKFADFIIYSDRGKRTVYNNIYTIVKQSYSFKIRNSNNILFNFQK